MKLYRLIYRIGMIKARTTLTRQYGASFYKQFKSSSAKWCRTVIEKTPDIGSTVFSFNYAFAPAYIAWYHAACEGGLDAAQTEKLLWTINETIFSLVPRALSKRYIKSYLDNFRRKAPDHEALSRAGRLHPYDYQIRFRNISSTVFEIDIYECGMMKLAQDFDALGMFPAICRVDYLLSNYMGAGFERTKTLGDGDDCCNCRYLYGGTCEWNPEKGFEDRK